MEKKTLVYGKPWETVAKCLTYKEANYKRGVLVEESDSFDFKVKHRSTENVFLVKRRIKDEVLQDRSRRDKNKKNKKSTNKKK